MVISASQLSGAAPAEAKPGDEGEARSGTASATGARGAEGSAPRALTPRARRTRARILRAAEGLFAERGFRGTRLADVAAAVGIRRASIVYYFPDKRALYDAVLADALGGLLARLEVALVGAAPLRSRIEAAVSAWVDYVGARPTLARLLLREAVEAGPEGASALAVHLSPFVGLVQGLIDAQPPLQPGESAIDPAHAAGAIAGATLFFVGAMARLVPQLGFDPLAPEHLASHRHEVLRIVDRLLGQGPSH